MEPASASPPPDSGASPASTGFVVDPDDLRTRFALAMSAMYKSEVPLYGDLIRIVQEVNQACLSSGGNVVIDEDDDDDDDNDGNHDPAIQASSERLTLERHGAIRLGTPEELATVRRIFAVLGMHAVGYYDLSVAGLPMHATCFRPRDAPSLGRNPFRVFTTLLRPELLRSDEAKELALTLLRQRRIFTAELLAVLDIAEAQGRRGGGSGAARLTPAQADLFIHQALLTFSWRPVAAATFAQYSLLKAEHPILADIACFRSAHINHLTPRTLDISAAQEAMRARGMAVKSRIEGPPPRRCPILLRQTSFLALEEAVSFMVDEGVDLPAGAGDGHDGEAEAEGLGLVEASHKARFGEIEERGAAVTPKGRRLYDRLLEEGVAEARDRDAGPAGVDEIMARVFGRCYPDDWRELRRQGLIYCEYHCTPGTEPLPESAVDNGWAGAGVPGSLLDHLIDRGLVEAVPITYEDFLPFSAAGIFQSNLHSGGKVVATSTVNLSVGTASGPDKEGLRKALGGELIDADQWYADTQAQSLERCALELGLRKEDLALK